jgi:DNA-binding MarR family transcriptional regulator
MLLPGGAADVGYPLPKGLDKCFVSEVFLTVVPEPLRVTPAVRALIESIPPDRSVGYLTRLMYLDMRRLLHEQLDAHGITSGTWYYLWALWHEDGINQRELGERVRIKEASTAVTLAIMERDGLIKRVRSKDDRRSVNVFLTPRGRKLERELAPYPLGGNVTALQGFTKSEVAVMLGFMERAVANLQAAHAERPRSRRRSA